MEWASYCWRANKSAVYAVDDGITDNILSKISIACDGQEVDNRLPDYTSSKGLEDMLLKCQFLSLTHWRGT